MTRRSSERRFFLVPSPLTNLILLFCLAWAAWKFGIALHAFCVMSNHYHLVLTDPHGRLPQFMAHLDLQRAGAERLVRPVGTGLGRGEVERVAPRGLLGPGFSGLLRALTS